MTQTEKDMLITELWKVWNQTMEIFQGMASAAPHYEKDMQGKFYISTYGLDAVGWCIEKVKAMPVDES